MKKLLMDDIPEQFIERQLNDSRYISKVVKGLLSNIVREKNDSGGYEPEAVSKNILVCTGSVTDRLKKDWGMNDVWNSIVYPRFERLNALTGTQCFGHWENKDGKKVFQTELPLEYQKGFSKKRIDHRHHAMDAIVIACATRNHVNYLSNESASRNAKISRYDLQRLLCDKSKVDGSGNYRWIIKKPWNTFTQDTREALDKIVISLKQNLRIINRTTNIYQHLDTKGNRVYKKQETGDSWAVRKPMHKGTVFGVVNLRRVKKVRLSVALDTPTMIVDKRVKGKVLELLSYKYDKKKIEKYFKENVFFWKDLDIAKVAVYYFTEDTSEPLVAVRKSLDSTFNEKKIKESVTDTGIQKILLNHLSVKEGKADLAFSAEGIEEMNRNILQLNDGKEHRPIYKVRVYEPRGNKFRVGTLGNKRAKWVEAAKGTNLFFAIYVTEDGKRTYATVPLNLVIEREKQGLIPVPDRNDRGDKLLFWLSPNDLVYLPTEEEREFGRINEPIDRGRIYKIVSFTGSRLYGVPCNVANVIVDKLEYYSLNKVELTDVKESIKEICIPIKIDRLGRIIEVKYRANE